jgi:hypothetical protein
MNEPKTTVLVEGLDKYFSEFDSTLSLVADLVRQRKHPSDVLILLCARLDALASDAADDETSNRQAFVGFLNSYGQQGDLFRSVSTGDLYWELGYHRWRLEGTVRQPGRLHRFSNIDDSLLHLLEYSGVPLTLRDCGQLLDSLMQILRSRFHVRPRQPRSKTLYASTNRVTEELVKGLERTRLRKLADNLPKALAPLLESKKIGSQLYQRFRCEAIHSAGVRLDQDRFFREVTLYWEPLHSEFYGSFELVTFPAQFLVKCLKSCLQTYRAHLLHKKKLPPAVHFHIFRDVMEHIELLDDTLIAGGGAVRLRYGRQL